MKPNFRTGKMSLTGINKRITTIRYNGVVECACIAYPDKVLTNVPKLFVKMREDVEFSSKDLYQFLAQRLETFKLPRMICEIDSFPRVGKTQKIDRKALRHYD